MRGHDREARPAHRFLQARPQQQRMRDLQRWRAQSPAQHEVRSRPGRGDEIFELPRDLTHDTVRLPEIAARHAAVEIAGSEQFHQAYEIESIGRPRFPFVRHVERFTVRGSLDVQRQRPIRSAMQFG